jgi:hypothetical protein
MVNNKLVNFMNFPFIFRIGNLRVHFFNNRFSSLYKIFCEIFVESREAEVAAVFGSKIVIWGEFLHVND